MSATDARQLTLLALAAFAALPDIAWSADPPVGMPPAPKSPDVDARQAPSGHALPADLESIARGFQAGTQRLAGSLQREPQLLVFVSLSMPEATLDRLVEQSAHAGAGLVLRGLAEGSLTRTVARLQRLIGQRATSIQIDPQAFDRFGVRQVPTFVLTKPNAEANGCATGLCDSGQRHVMASGDVSLDYALSVFERSAPDHAADARTFLRRLKPQQKR